MSDLHTASLLEIRSRLAAGEVRAEDVARACLERIKATEPSLHALLAVREEALEEARALDKEGPRPEKPLWGVPVTIKDAITTAGTRTTAASKILEHFVPFYDAFAVKKLREAGAIILGKANMDEFAMGSSTENSAYGPTHNPRDLSTVPGGSSGGSAASVAAMQCYASLGSDTGGSIRQPAALCGCVGLKPTYGAVSRYGLLAYGSSLDQIGPLTRTVADAALVFSVIAGHDPRDNTSAPRPDPAKDLADIIQAQTDLKGFKIGVPAEFLHMEGMDPAVLSACERTLEMARGLGAELVEVSLPHSTRHAIAAYYIIAMAEASSNLARYDGVRYGHRSPKASTLEELYTLSRTEGVGPEVQRRILLGAYVLSAGYYDAYYRKAAEVRRLIRQDFHSALERCDIMLAPVSPVPAWKLGSIIDDPLKMYLMDIFTVSLNLAGLPGLSFPVGKAGNLPVGMQVIGREFDERTVFRAAHALEKQIGDLAFPCL
ncbi:MAG: Asp-tRNA(Asn)/Glu-tRNA(Gln) amidotransferase subunit GatA [Desulfovibrionaceae bacterium]|nr:Asp-tRNA(Asn)/Glu-tRNA(Gln) amidotransferase subunit GatA [Desulfovibrionaceae bacterium]